MVKKQKHFPSLFSRLQDDPTLKWSGTYFSMLGSFSTAFTHVLCFKALRDPAECFWHGMHYLIAHFLCLKMVRNKWQPWPVAHCLIAHLLCFKMVRNIYLQNWLCGNCLVTHFLCLKVVTNSCQYQWISLNCFNAYALFFKTIWDIHQWT